MPEAASAQWIQTGQATSKRLAGGVQSYMETRSDGLGHWGTKWLQSTAASRPAAITLKEATALLYGSQ
jgi:hypothetical protein